MAQMYNWGLATYYGRMQQRPIQIQQSTKIPNHNHQQKFTPNWYKDRVWLTTVSLM